MGGVAAAVAWLLGVALQLQQAALWPVASYAALAALAPALAVAGWFWRPARWVLLGLALLALGLSSAGLRATQRLADTLPAALEGRDVVVTGVVAQMPRTGLSGTRFVFEVETASYQGKPVVLPELLALGWYRGFDVDAWLSGPARELRAGQRWRLTVRLKQPHGTVNPGGFDLELWLFEQGIRASGYVRATPSDVNERLADGVAHPFERARQAVRDAIERQVRDPLAAGVLAALAIGDQGAIDGLG